MKIEYQYPSHFGYIDGVDGVDIAGKEYKGYILLDEATLNRVTTHHDVSGYTIISASRDAIHSNGKAWKQGEPKDDLLTGDALRAENNRRTKELMRQIIADNHSFLPVYGGFIEKSIDKGTGKETKTPVYEKSFIIFDFDRKGNKCDMNDVIRDTLKYAQKFDQEAVLIKKPNEAPYYANGSTGETDMTFSGEYTLNDIAQEYFTALKHFGKPTDNPEELKGKPQRFTFEGMLANPAPDHYSERHLRWMTNELFV